MKKIFCFALSVLLLAGCGDRAQAAKKEMTRNFVEEGTTLLKQGKVVEAVKVFQEAMAQNPSDTKAPLILAQLFMQTGNYESAIPYFTRVLQLEPENGQAYLLLGGCYDLMGKKDMAIENVQKSVGIFQKQRDEQNFRQSVVILRTLVESQGQPKAN